MSGHGDEGTPDPTIGAVSVPSPRRHVSAQVEDAIHRWLRAAADVATGRPA